METAPEHQKNKPRTGLAMEGGAMRGMFTCGVTDVFLENGITFDAAAGISAGAVCATTKLTAGTRATAVCAP